MSFNNKKIINSSRKDHICVHCGLKIPKGSSYIRDTGIFEGDFYSEKQHTECRAKYVEINKDSDDYWMRFEEFEDEEFNLDEWKNNIQKIYGVSEE